jgi:hypothetical protein
MGGTFVIVATLCRAVFLILAGASITVVSVIRIVEMNQHLFNPFASYDNIRHWRYGSDLEAHGFTCRLNFNASTNMGQCSMRLSDGAISEIEVGFSPNSDEMTHATFTLREKLVLGHLILLWGKPEKIERYRQMAFLRWSHHQVSATIQTDNRHISHWLPITQLTFNSAD